MDQAQKLLESHSEALIKLVEKKFKEGKNQAYWSEVQALYNLRNVKEKSSFPYAPALNAAKIEPTNDHYLVTWAQTLTEMGKKAQAQQVLEKVLKRSPKDARAHALQAFILISEGNNNDFAEDEIKTAIKLNPTDPDVNYLASQVYKKLFKDEECIEALKRWTKAHPNDALAHLILGNFIWDMRDRQKGLEECKLAVKINPDFTRAQLSLINMYHKSGKLKELIAHTTSVLSSDKSTLGKTEAVWTQRADAFREFKQWDKAATEYGLGLKALVPDTSENVFSPDIRHMDSHSRRRYFEIWLARCQMLNAAGKSKQALELISKMILAMPDNPGARQTRIEILDSAKKYELALIDVNYLILKDPDVAEWYKMKADFQRKLNRPADAAATEKRMKEVIKFGSKSN